MKQYVSTLALLLFPLFFTAATDVTKEGDAEVGRYEETDLSLQEVQDRKDPWDEDEEDLPGAGEVFFGRNHALKAYAKSPHWWKKAVLDTFWFRIFFIVLIGWGIRRWMQATKKE